MKQKQLEIALQKHVRFFEKPKIQLEQYHTPPGLAATVVHAMYGNGDVADLTVCDLGCGTGMLSIACALMGAERVIAVDVDEDALAVLRANVERFEGEVELEVVCQDVKEFQRETLCDVVVMNPPFGTKKKGADMEFLVAASKVGRVIYSMHKTTTRKHVDKTGASCGLKGRPIAQLRYNLDKSYDFHKKKSLDIEVDLWRFEHK